jgi:hypothetical protein
MRCGQAVGVDDLQRLAHVDVDRRLIRPLIV